MSSYIHDDLPIPPEYEAWHQQVIKHYIFQHSGSKIGMCSRCGKYQAFDSTKCIECGSALIPRRVTKLFNPKSYYQSTACGRIHKIGDRVLYSYYIATTNITSDHHEQTTIFEAERQFVGFPIGDQKSRVRLTCARFSPDDNWNNDCIYSDYYFGSPQKNKRNQFIMIPDDYPAFFADTEAKYTCLGEYMKEHFADSKPHPTYFISEYWAALNWEWIELLWKAGFKNLYEGILDGLVDRRMITKNTIKDMRKELKELGNPTADEVMILRKVKQNKLHFKVSEIKGLTLYAVELVIDAMKLTGESQGKCLRYLSEVCRQENDGCCGRFGSVPTTAVVQQEWIDYLNMVLEIEGAIDPKKAFPKDPAKAHQDILTVKNALKNELRAKDQIKIAEDKGIAEMLAETIKEYNLDRLEYVDPSGYMIIAMKSIKDIVDEGSMMNHCVGGLQYIEGVARGESFIFSLRKTEEPNRPIGTIQWKPMGGIVQCRGYDNKEGTLPPNYKVVLNNWQKHLKEANA